MFMEKKEKLLLRLEEIGQSLSKREDALALLGLGSVGVELNRLDEYSDIDFFVIVKNNTKSKFINNTDWLETSSPLDYKFQNTNDGFKIMYADGVYGECAIFDEEEIKKADYSEGRIVWKSSEFSDLSINIPKKEFHRDLPKSIEYDVNEALTNLYVGLCRYKRGELLSSTRFIQSYAVDGLIRVLHLIEESQNNQQDKFNQDRRIEQCYPVFSKNLPDFVQGYNRNRESAIKILEFMEKIYDVNKKMAAEIRNLVK
jgi:hypothetical protein